jgi:hypothetical protein
MAEEASAAVESMKQQITRLVESMSEFKLAGSAGGAARALPAVRRAA